jgi:hypothetical protein
VDKDLERQVIREIGGDGFLAYTEWKRLLHKHVSMRGTAEEIDIVGAQEFEAWKAFAPYLKNLKTDIHDDD